MEILCFFAGMTFFYCHSIYSLLLLALALLLRPRLIFIAWFLLAMIWGVLHAYCGSVERGIPNVLSLQAHLKGQVISLPTIKEDKTEFQLLAMQYNGNPVNARILLSCYQHCPHFKVGQIWSFSAKLKKPFNLENPGGFNYLQWLDTRHIHWVGYIDSKTLHLESSTEFNLLNLLALREYLATSISLMISNPEVLGVFQALSLGITTNLDKALWDLFRRTGTTHLMVISGAHIGLVAGLTSKSIYFLWSRISWLCLYYPAIQIGGIIGCLMALIYALLAGFSPPAQRSLLSCFFLISRFFSCRFTAWQAWRYALLGVILYEPHAVLLPGFYLSFIAVAILLTTSQRITYLGFRKTMAIQLACLLGLMPLTLYWFSYGAVNGLIANLVAIPLVGFIVVPLSLLSLLVIQWFNWEVLVWPVNKAIEILLIYLRWIDSFSFINLDFSFPTLMSPLAMMLGMGILFILPLKPLRFAAVILIITALFPSYPRVNIGDAQCYVLDIGQGLAVVIKTAHHILIYDTGLKFYRGGDMGKLAIIPFLKTLGIKTIDKVVISHPDLDHRGGLPSLEKEYPIRELIVDNVNFYHRGVNCHTYPSWNWDGVSFRFFKIKTQFTDKNNTSCVLQIKNKEGSVLLTGDIEKLAENYLANTYRRKLASTILVVPHHGSKTSSSPNFIKNILPQYAIISSGIDNRYHFPHVQTLNTLKNYHVVTYNTADCGMVSFKLNKAPPSCYVARSVKTSQDA